MPKSIFESDIDKATSEYNVQEDWQLIMDVCDRIKTAQNGPKESLKCIMKRVRHPVPHVAMQALTLLSACINNCGKPYHLEICSRDWTNEARSIITSSHEKVSQKLGELVAKWASDFKNDPQLNLMVQFHKKLKSEGYAFDLPEDTTKVSAVSSTKKKVSTEDEINFKEDLDLAIAMSLQESEPQPQATAQSLYPSVTAPSSFYQEESEICKVCALYDFEAAEDNEMTFKAGEIFSVLDNSDENWWKGQNSRGVGLFPATFVTTEIAEAKAEKKVRFADAEVDSQPKKQKAVKHEVAINEEQLDLTLSMLKNASSNEIDDEEETIIGMEESAREMGILIEKKIVECNRQVDDLGDLNTKYLQALGMYQQLMKEPMNAVQPPSQQHTQPNYHYYNGTTSQMHAMQYEQQYMLPNHHQHLSYSHGYSSLPESSTYDNSYVYHQGSQLASLPPILGTPQPLPQIPVSSPQHGMLPQHYSQHHAVPQQTASLPYDQQQQQQTLYTTQQPIQQYESTGQYYNSPGQYGQQTAEHSSYGYGIPQNGQTYQQTSVYQ